MTHQQRTIPSEPLKIAWLAGIFDGEGTIGMYPIKARPGQYLLGAVIVNTDEKILSRVEEIYDSLGINSKRHLKTPWHERYKKSFMGRKPCYEIVVRRMFDLDKLLRLLLPEMVGKKKENVLRIIKYLESLPSIKGRVTTKREPPSNRMKL